MAQLTGFLLLVLGLYLLTGSVLPLLVGGVLLLLVPEITATVRRGEKEAKR